MGILETFTMASKIHVYSSLAIQHISSTRRHHACRNVSIDICFVCSCSSCCSTAVFTLYFNKLNMTCTFFEMSEIAFFILKFYSSYIFIPVIENLKISISELSFKLLPYRSENTYKILDIGFSSLYLLRYDPDRITLLFAVTFKICLL